MNGISCDICNTGLLIDENVRYEVTIEVKAAYDPMEITGDDLQRDLEAEMKEALRRAGKLTAEEAQDKVYRKMKFDLCRACQKNYLKSPLGQ